MTWTTKKNDEIYHHGILGQKWGIRRFQNADGSYTPAGKKRYGRLTQAGQIQNRLNDLDKETSKKKGRSVFNREVADFDKRNSKRLEYLGLGESKLNSFLKTRYAKRMVKDKTTRDSVERGRMEIAQLKQRAKDKGFDVSEFPILRSANHGLYGGVYETHGNHYSVKDKKN